LLEAFELYHDSTIGAWKKVAQYISAHMLYSDPTPSQLESSPLIVSNHQCGERYKHHLHPEIKQRKIGPWTHEEVVLNNDLPIYFIHTMYSQQIEQLRVLVAENQRVYFSDSSGKSRLKINWAIISRNLNRNYRQCQHTWSSISKQPIKSGLFTIQESTFITKFVEQNGENSSTWTILETELGRKRRSIQDKYNLMKRSKTN
jgi:hypothetical protein